MKLFHRDENLPATELIFDTSALAERMRPWMGEDAAVPVIMNIRYKPGTSCVVSYKTESLGRDSLFHIKAFRKDDWPTRKHNLVCKTANVLFDDQYSYALFRFPDDAALPGLKMFLDDPARILSRVLLDKMSDEELVNYESLAYKPNRRFVARLRFKSGKNLVLKFHDESTYDRALKSADLTKTARFCGMPTRAGRSNRYRALAYDWIDGTALDLSSKSVSEVKYLVDMLFEYLNRLHVPSGCFNRKFVAQKPNAGIGEVAYFLGELVPPINAMVARISSSIQANLVTPQRKTLIHGDFNEKQLIVSPSGVLACDFDNCCLGDPTADLANLVSHLQFREFQGEFPLELLNQIDDSSRRYLSDQNDPSNLKRYVWNRIAALFRLATNLFRSGVEDWMVRTEQLLMIIETQIRRATAGTIAKPLSLNQDERSSVKRDVQAVARQHPKLPGLSHDVLRSDLKFGFLMGALEPGIAESVLKRDIPQLTAQYGNFEISSIHLRRHKPGRRCLLEFALETDFGRKKILGKASAKRLDRKAVKSQSQLFNKHGFDYGSADQISVPKPIGACPAWNMWFQEKVFATRGAAFLENGRLNSVTGSIALALAKLHQCGFKSRRQHTFQDEFDTLASLLNQVAAAQPNHAKAINRILRNCNLARKITESQFVAPLHRDFYQDQIMFANDRTFLVDVDLISQGHPALDVGNFLAHLVEHGIRCFDDPNYWIVEEQEIIQHYLANTCFPLEAEIMAYKSVSLARHIFISWARPERNPNFSKFVELADELTAGMARVDNLKICSS